MTEKRYRLKHYDFVRGWAKDAEVKTGLTRKQLLKRIENVLDTNRAPKIEIELWRDG